MRREKKELDQKVLKTIEKYNLIQNGDKIVIGVSGGPDSMCLLDILCCLKKRLNIEIVVAHVNHMIREEAEEETKYVQNYCIKNEILCFIKYADVTTIASEKKVGTEEMGRKIRYNFFEEVAKKSGANKIATAHNANDNAETVLMNIIRGSGTSGLKGIEIKRSVKIKENEKEENQQELTYIRPLKECNRAEIEDYCILKKINPKIDKSNLENIYTRNQIRNELIPYLQKKFNPNIIDALNRMSDLAKEDDEYFLNVVKQEYEKLKIGENERDIKQCKNDVYDKISENGNIILDLKGFNNLTKVIKGKLLLYTINKAIGTTQGIEKVNIDDIIRLCENNVGNKYLMPNKYIKVFVRKGKIFFTKL